MLGENPVTRLTINSPDEWDFAVNQAYIPLTVTDVVPDFHGELVNVTLPGDVTVGRIDASRSTYVRNETMIRREPRDHIMFLLPKAGEGASQQGDRHATLLPNAGTFHFTENFARVSPPPSLQLVFLERSVLRMTMAEIRDLVARPLGSADSASLRVLSRLIDEITMIEPAKTSPGDWEAIAHATAVLLRGLAGSIQSRNGISGIEESQLALRRAVLLCIEQTFTNPDTDPQTIADRLHISRRQLYRVLEESEIAPASHIKNLRLSHARRLLIEGASVEAASRRSGFANVATFRRAFKQRYGVRPYTIRAGDVQAF